MASGRPGALRRLADRLGRPRDEIDADTMTAESTEVGAVPIGAVRLRARATVVGEIRSVTLRPRGDVPALVVELWDGTDALHLVWLGRRTIPGIEPGISLEATGRVTKHRGAITIFNPAYEIVLHGSHHG